MNTRLVLSLMLFFVLWGCESSMQEVNIDQIRDNNGILYLKDAQEPYSGKVFSNYESGQRESSGVYRHGKPAGPIETWYLSGQQRTLLTYTNDGNHQKTETWYESGKRQSMIVFAESGSEVTEWYENEREKTVAQYNKDGQLEGTLTSWHSNGELKEEGNYGAGLVQNGTKTWHDNGQLATSWSGTEEELILTSWNEEGVKIEESAHQNGKKHGLTNLWYGPDKPAFEGNYVKGEPEGTHRYWNLNGELAKEEVYENGILVSGENPESE